MTDDDNQPQPVDLFANPGTSLEDIEAAGWKRYYSSSGAWWFEREVNGKRERYFLPRWVYQLINESEREGVLRARECILSALGLTASGLGKPVKVSTTADQL